MLSGPIHADSQSPALAPSKETPGLLPGSQARPGDSDFMVGQCIPVAPPSPHHTPLPGRCSLNFLYIIIIVFFFTGCIADLLPLWGIKKP